MQLSRSVFIFATSLAAKAQATNDFDPGRKTVLAVDWNARFEPSEADAVGVTAGGIQPEQPPAPPKKMAAASARAPGQAGQVLPEAEAAAAAAAAPPSFLQVGLTKLAAAVRTKAAAAARMASHALSKASHTKDDATKVGIAAAAVVVMFVVGAVVISRNCFSRGPSEELLLPEGFAVSSGAAALGAPSPGGLTNPARRPEGDLPRPPTRRDRRAQTLHGAGQPGAQEAREQGRAKREERARAQTYS